MKRRLVSANTPYETVLGYSRAVVVGPHVFVAGTAPIMPDGADPPADAYAQMRRCLDIALAALTDAGARAEHVVRTRIYLTSAEDFDAVARAHGEVFGNIRPANTSLVVAGFVDSRWLVEVELDALIA